MASLKNLIEKAKEHLDEGEAVLVGIKGSYEIERLGRASVRSGVFLATSKKALFYAKKLTGYDLEVFPYSNISSIESSKGMMGHKITLFASGNKATMKWIKEGDADKFIAEVRGRIGKKEEGPVAAAQDDIPTQIKKLAELKEQGILSEEEFETKKKELLAKM